LVRAPEAAFPLRHAGLSLPARLTVRILVVEDEPTIASAIRSILEEAALAVDVVADGSAAITWAGTYPYDLVILDVVLPGMDGVTVCRKLREGGSKTPILMLTALDAIEDRVAGLDAGADDYLAKPFAAAELLARVRALRRRGVGEAVPVLRVGDLDLDPASREVRRGGKAIRLTTKEFALLEVLARHPGQVFPQERLIDAVWDADFAAESNIVEVYIRSLRRKIDGGRRDGLIETIRGSGYRLRPDPPEPA
jgi:DNA-binding response OmpR family regulator